MKNIINNQIKGYFIFLSFVFVCLTGLLKSSFVGGVILGVVAFIFLFLMYFIYRIGVNVYEAKLKAIIKDFKKTKSKIQND